MGREHDGECDGVMNIHGRGGTCKMHFGAQVSPRPKRESQSLEE